ncbi:hypothetical protein ACUYOF_23225 [Photobacterium ganghwense]|uniref:hypothetical protein n=1 Tax=Photobacterium ganghwense TaxID=320778 RepID=UPI00405761B0
MRLKVQVEKINATNVDIAWFAGLNNHGIVTVQIAQREFRCAIAELTAARFLLLDKQVLGRVPNSGKGLALSLTKETILAAKNEDLKATALFLSNRLSGIKLYSDDIVDITHPEEKDIITPYASPYPTFEVPKLGTIAISNHAMQRYQQRHRQGDIRNPWCSLQKQLSHPNLEKLTLSSKTRFQKLLRYVGSEQHEVWVNPTGNLYFQIASLAEHKLVVTVFSRATHTFGEVHA